MVKVALDIHGGDHAPDVNIIGAVNAMSESDGNLHVCLVGDKDQAIKVLEREGVDPSLFSFEHCNDCISMGDHPVRAFMSKPNSSISKGFSLLKSKGVDAFASTGNTGAMLVGAMQTVKSIPGIIRPCISSILPHTDGSVGLLLDVGTNADCKPDVLYQFGILGSIFAREVYKIENPRVALLNIGEEEEKGNLLTKAAYQLMNENQLINFIGNIEGSDLFTPKADVVICDGFTGNVVLKQAEGFYELIKERNIEDEYFNQFNYEEYGGTPILGVNGNVLIGHGKSSDVAVKKMLKLATEVSDANLPEKISKVFI
jgi:glycerol-3-phosphate acyltransferase PlsX